MGRMKGRVWQRQQEHAEGSERGREDVLKKSKARRGAAAG